MSRALICQGFSLLMCCFIIEMKATPDYESGLDIDSCATVIILGLGFFKKVLISLVSIAEGETLCCNGKLASLEAGARAWGQN